jgi:hypothetical protein
VVKLSSVTTATRRPFITTNANNPDEIDVDFDWLSRPWGEVVALVEHASGRTAVVRAERGFESI